MTFAADTVEQALHTIERRVNELGVAEPVVARYSDGRSDPRAAPGRRRRRSCEADHQVDGPAPSDAGRAAGRFRAATRRCRPTTTRCRQPRGAARAVRSGRAPMRPLSTSSRRHRRSPATTCAMRGSRVDEFNRPAVAFTLKRGCRAALRRVHRAHTSTARWRRSR